MWQPEGEFWHIPKSGGRHRLERATTAGPPCHPLPYEADWNQYLGMNGSNLKLRPPAIALVVVVEVVERCASGYMTLLD